MDLPLIYLVIILAYIILAIGLYMEDLIILMFSSLLLLFLASYMYMFGIDIFINDLTFYFAVITFAIGAYVGTRSGLELIKEGGL